MDTLKPYLLRSVLQWCLDHHFDPQILVEVDENCEVPKDFIADGQIVFSLHPEAAMDLLIDKNFISFEGCFNLDQVDAQSVYVPMERVAGIYAMEQKNGLFFDVQPSQPKSRAQKQKNATNMQKSLLKIIK